MHIVIPTIDVGAILKPGDLIAWLLVGLIAGFLANTFIRGRSAGCIGNTIVGLIGSVIGGVLASIFELGTFHFCGSIVVSFIGASLLLAVLQLFTGK
jgi:uncharacterized membrane protein YeaQ/YmgE (transglycosylase-associated protein family)